MTTNIASIVDELHTIAAKIAPYVAFAQVAESATGIGGPPAVIAVSIIKAGVDALAKGATGALTADQVATEMRGLLARVAASEAANDAAADAVVEARRNKPKAP